MNGRAEGTNWPAITDASNLLFGKAPRPVRCGHDVVIGGGQVLPEINFTLPQMTVDESTRPEIQAQYSEIIHEVCQRAVELQVPALVVEFELLPPMTLSPEWGAEITELLAESLEKFHQQYGLKSALRVTPVDVRDNERPPRMRSGHLLEKTLESFERCARAGAHLLSIESTGGKELHDAALLNADLQGVVFSLGVLAVTDMRFLWQNIVDVANRTQTIPAGDTACGFANTAMILADKGILPKVFATVVRTAAIVRSLQAYLQGAIGPSKDCAYEGPFLKVMTGIPISMEGKTSACAHLSSIGNISAAYCDLWSNESVQNVRLLSTYAPVVSLEQLVYDCRLHNVALRQGQAAVRQLRDWLIESDAYLDPQAYVFRREVVLRLSRKMLACASPLEMTFCAVDETLALLRAAHQNRELVLSGTEKRWLDRLSAQVELIPREQDRLWEAVKSGALEVNMNPEEYSLE